MGENPAIHRFMWKNKEGLMVIRAFVHLVKAGRQPFAADEGGRAAILCRQTRHQRCEKQITKRVQYET